MIDRLQERQILSQRAVMAFQGSVAGEKPIGPLILSENELAVREKVIGQTLTNDNAEAWRLFLLDHLHPECVMAKQLEDGSAIITLTPRAKVDVSDDFDWMFHSIRRIIQRCGIHFDKDGFLYHVSSHERMDTYNTSECRAYPIGELAKARTRSFPGMMRELGEFTSTQFGNALPAEKLAEFVAGQTVLAGIPLPKHRIN